MSDTFWFWFCWLVLIPGGLIALGFGVRNSIEIHTRQLGDALERELRKR